MYQVLIVDDEPIIRKSIMNLIDWGEYQMELAGEAYNGKDALDMIKEKDIDLVFTDIKMPVMDGLELMKQASALKSDLKFVVLSAYDEFEIVRLAYKLGAFDYLLKPEISEKRLDEVLTGYLDLMINQTSHSQTGLNNMIEDATREKAWKEFIWGNPTINSRSVDFLKENGVDLDNNWFFILNIYIENYTKLLAADWEGDSELFKFAILNVVNEVKKDEVANDVFFNMPDELAFVFFSRKPEIPSCAYTIYENIRADLKRTLNIVISGGLSSNPQKAAALKKAYHEAETARRASFYAGKRHLVVADTFSSFQAKEPFQEYPYVQKLKEILSNMINGEQKLPYTSLCIRSGSLDDIEPIKNLFQLYCHTIAEFISANELPCTEDIVYFQDNLARTGTLLELNRWIVAALENLANAAQNGFDIVAKAKKYIDGHYNERITLPSIAHAIGVSSNYLSSLFTKKLGQSYIDYLSDVRIKEAIRLIRTNEYKMYEIAAMVGYNNVEHFSRIFKKHTGKSPKQFIQRSNSEK